jgi:exopolyphosphatase/guanosine-5'-triphosphate,3'-diphosphate pyrophosphatase
MSSISQHPDRLDLDVVAGQLQRASWTELHAVTRIAGRCRWQLPAVIESRPYDAAGRPFPTLFYLTCPTAVAAVAKLESAGGIARLTTVLQEDAGLRRSLLQAEAYERRRRTSLATVRPSDGGTAVDEGAALRSGIAGRSRRSRSDRTGGLKCLHAHAAHALARPGYAFGELVLEQARDCAALWCDDARCLRLRRDGVAGEAAPAAASRIALVDLGTNTCRLFLGTVGPYWCGPIEHHTRTTRVVRLGEGVDEHGQLLPAAVQRTRDCLAEYAELITEYEPDARRLIATSVLRDATDGRAFLDAVRRDFDLPWRILSGAQEGAAAFRGAVCGPAGAPGVLLVVDIGGGSTELVIGRLPDPATAQDEPTAAGRPCSMTAARRQGRPQPSFVRSIDIGAVRLTERFFRHDPPTSGEWGAAVRFAQRSLAAAVPEHVRADIDRAIGVAGTVTTLVANKLGLRHYRPQLVDGQPLHVWEIERAIATFRRLTSRERGALPGIQPGREDVILAGALIAREVCRLFGLPGVSCGESDILEGAALDLAEEHLAEGRRSG